MGIGGSSSELALEGLACPRTAQLSKRKSRPASVDVVSACWSSSRERLVETSPSKKSQHGGGDGPLRPVSLLLPIDLADVWRVVTIELSHAGFPADAIRSFLAPSGQPKPHRGDESRVRVKRHSIVESRLSCPRFVRRRCASPASGSTPSGSCRCPRCATTEGLAAIRRARDRTSRLHVPSAACRERSSRRRPCLPTWLRVSVVRPRLLRYPSPGVHSPARFCDGIDRLHGRIVHAPRGAHPGEGTTS